LQATGLSTPQDARAGRIFGAAVSVVSQPEGAVVRTGSVNCLGFVGKHQLRALVHAFRHARATCQWRLPRSAAGRTLRTTIVVRSGTLRVATRAAFAVAR
jgi:hypothetical protein